MSPGLRVTTNRPTYDGAGRRIAPGGSLARVGLPAGNASATYDANNRLIEWNGATLTYDLNGNLENDGSRAYTWNARGQLTGIGGSTSASFTYDGLGRRIGKTVAGVTTGFVYDGLNFVQEKDGTGAGATPTANLVTGLGLDETFLRMTGTGAGAAVSALLRDGNNNTVHLTNGTYTVTDSYGYEPYGSVAQQGSSANSQQFTGRENDNTGLYYYRARYYNPAFGRFISEDPIALAAGPNVYAYVDGDPINYTDPLGLQMRGMPEEPGDTTSFPPVRGPNDPVPPTVTRLPDPSSVSPAPMPPQPRMPFVQTISDIPKNISRVITGLLPKRPARFQPPGGVGPRGQRDPSSVICEP